MIRSVLVVVTALISTPVSSETVNGVVDLAPSACTDTPRSSFIQRVCYDKTQSYMLINLRGTYYHYCELPPATFDAFMTASPWGNFTIRISKAQVQMGRTIVGRIGCRAIEVAATR